VDYDGAITGGFNFSAGNLPAGATLSNNIANSSIDLVVAVTSNPPTISSAQASGNSLIFSGTGGTAGGTYAVLSSTNVSVPRTNWIPIVTNVFGAGGSFSVTNTIVPGLPGSFFILRVP
jgi:hypothetical protein